MTPQPPTATGWNFALAVLSEWRRTVAVIIIIMLLGWPLMVIKRWAEDAGVVDNIPLVEQETRQLEHTKQDAMLTLLSTTTIEQAAITRSILLELKSHGIGAAQDRQMLAYFTWKQCTTDNGPDAKICEQFEDLGPQTHSAPH